MLIFFLVLTLGFAFELGKNALSIESRQTWSLNENDNENKDNDNNESLNNVVGLINNTSNV
jgi:hypothetical protein